MSPLHYRRLLVDVVVAVYLRDGYSAFSSHLTRTSQWKQHLHSLQQQLWAVWEPLESRQDHNMVLVLHELHKVSFTYWKHKKYSAAINKTVKYKSMQKN